MAPEVQQLLGEFKGYKTGKTEEPTVVVAESPKGPEEPPVAPVVAGTALDEFQEK